MFPSTGHFKSLHCPFHLEDNCGRIYCHFRHVKNVTEKLNENGQLLALKNLICKVMKIDEETFNTIMNEVDEHTLEKNLNSRLKKIFPNHTKLIDDFRFPESLNKDSFELSLSDDSIDESACDLINLTEQDDDTPLDEGPLKQFLEEDAKRNSNAEQKNRDTLEKRHIIISCLEKMDKREFNPRRSAQPKNHNSSTKENSSDVTSAVDLNDVCTQPVTIDTIRIKQEDDGSESSESEDNAEVDNILNQMELLNPQLFSSEECLPLKREPVDSNDERDNELEVDFASQETIAASQISGYNRENNLNNQKILSSAPTFRQPAPPETNSENRYGRINPKSVQAINNEVSHLVSAPSKDIKPEMNNHSERTSSNSVILTAASIAEQNRLKNVFKNTICANIDQFFDLCDACKVYGTEIFNLLEPLLNYLIEKLNPEFNFEKLRQLHAQNISLTCGLPFVSSCEHAKDCIECHNLLQCAMTKCRMEKEEKSTQTSSSNSNSSVTDTPLRKIEAGLYDITKEIISLGIPMDDSELPVNARNATQRCADVKDAQCQTESSSHSRRSSLDKHHTDKKHSSHDNRSQSSRKSKSSSSSDSRKRHDESKRSSSDKHSRHSRSEHKSSRSSSDSHRKKRPQKSQSDDDSGDEDREKNSKKHRSTSSKEHTSKKRSSDEKVSTESKKHKSDSSSSSKSHNDAKKAKEKETISIDTSSEDSVDSNCSGVGDNILPFDISDDDSDNKDGLMKDAEDGSSSEDEEVDENSILGKQNSDEFTDKYPETAGKKRVSHVTESTSYLAQRKHQVKKNIPSPAEVLFQRMQQVKKVETPAEPPPSNQLANDRVRISHVPNVALLLKAKEQIKNNMYQPIKPASVPIKTIAQTIIKGSSRIAHVPIEPPKPKDVPASAANVRPKINSSKSTNNIPLPIRQSGLDRLYNAFAKKVPPDMACELALKEERTIHEKVTIQKIYLNSLAMAVHRISKENPAKLVQKNTDFPSEINGLSTYDLLSKHVLTYEELEINGFPLSIADEPGCCRVSTKAIHYKPLSSKRSGDRFYCLQCKDLFDVDPETGIPITPASGCKFHQMRPRKEPGRTRHDVFYPCCNKSISESGCMTAEYHTPDTTDDDMMEGYLETREAPPGESSKTYYSMDCEMCYTTVGPELTRVTIIGPDCSTVYDSLVKPRNKILDYCTKFSGITKEKLRHVTKTLEEVRQELFKFIFKETILIGHSLENDLKAMKILHRNIVDTSVMYPHRDAPERKFALKFLSSREVQFLIQESEFGHDSKEDALACMKLVWKKIREDAQSFRPRKIIGSPERHK